MPDEPIDPLAREPLLGLLGPTAAGKSALGAALARALGLEVLSLDSMLVYRGLDIGTAKPTLEERLGVRHQLIDIADPRERFDVTRYVSAAQGAEAELRERGARGLYVGGSLFYLRALTHGLFAGPEHDAELRAELEARAEAAGLAPLYAELERVDPLSAARLHPNDKKRVLRALEVWLQSGRALSDWQREWRHQETELPGRPRFLLGVLPPTEQLESRFAQRVEAMLEAGWLEEVRALEAAGAFGLTASQALGYSQVRAHLRGEFDRRELVRRVALATRQFARSQRTWLRRYPDIAWAPPECFDAADPRPEALLDWALETLGRALEAGG